MSIAAKTIADLQIEFAQEAARSLSHLQRRDGMVLRASIRNRETHRQIRRTADASYYNPLTCEVAFYYEPEQETGSEKSSAVTQEEIRLRDVVLALDGAERDPRFRDFIGIKTFRDQFLQSRGLGWAQDPDVRRSLLSTAIDRGMVLRNSVPNPKSPSYPTTAIRVNREHPDVSRILGAATLDRAVFKPVSIRGEALSSTLLRERR